MAVTAALAGGRGSRRDQFSRTAGDAARSMTLALEMLLPAGPQTRVRYEIVIERSDEATGLTGLRIGRERLAAIRRQDDRWMTRHPALAKAACYGQALSVTERSSVVTALNPYTTAIIARPDASDPFAPGPKVVKFSAYSGRRLIA